MTDIATTLGLWIPQVQGRYLNEDGAYGAQCWDTAANWSKHLGLPIISTGGRGRWPGWAGNMVDAFPQSAAIAAAYELLPPSADARGGDILVWGDGNPTVYPKTHVAVAVRDLGAQLLTVSQNSSASLPGNPYPQWTTGPTILQHLPRKGLIGIIRPRTGTNPQGTTTPTEEEDDLMATPEQRRQLIAEIMTHPVTQPDGVVTNLESVIREYRSHVTAAAEATGAVAGQVLNTSIPRGGQPGETTLAAVASWHDAHIVAVIDSVSKATGADVEKIKQAVLDGLKQGVKITVAVEGTE